MNIKVVVKFLWLNICFKLQMKAWGWFPILFLTFWELSKCWSNLGPLDPLLLTEIRLKLHGKTVDFLNIIFAIICTLGHVRIARARLFDY